MNAPVEPAFVHRIVHRVGARVLSVLKFDRCPRAWLRDEAPRAPELIADFRWLKVYGVLPEAGGKLDQDLRFVDAVEVLGLEVEREAAQLRGERTDGTDREQ